MKMTKNRVLSIIMLVLSVVVIIGASKLPVSNLQRDPGPAFFPYFLSVIMIIASVILFFQKSKDEKPFMTKDEYKRMFILFGLFIVYAVLFYLLGVYRTVPLVLLSLCYLFSRGRKLPFWKLLIYTAVAWAFIYILFKYVIVMAMPKGLLFS